MKKILITGAAGFIGSTLANFISNKDKLILVDDMSQGNTSNLNKDLLPKLIKKAIQDVPINFFKNVDCIIHLAAQSVVRFSITDFYKSSKKNINSSLYVFEIARKFNIPVIYASSCAVYGSFKIGNDYKENKVGILSPYAQDKYTVEQYAKIMSKVFKVRTVGLRFFNIYGPNQKESNPYSGVIPIFVNRAKKNKTIKINGGNQTRDFVFVEDVVKILLLLRKKIIEDKKNVSKIFNVCTGKSISVNNIYKNIILFTKSSSKKKYYKLLSGDPIKSSGSNNKLLKYLKIKNSFFTEFKKGLEITINANK